MAYRPLNIRGGNNAVNTTTLMAEKGVNLRDLPQLLKPEYAQIIRNYIPTAQGGLQKRKGITLLKNASSATAITMLEKWTDDIYIFGYGGTKVASYTKSTDTVTDIKTNFNDIVTDGARYSDGYFFVASPKDKIGRITRTLDYDGQTGNFTAGLIVTGTISGATALILSDADAGATGTLTLANISGTFQNNEALTDTGTGAAVANGTVTFTYTEITAAPKARHITVVDTRLIAGNLESDTTAIQYSAVDSGTNPPFTNWTDSTASTASGTVRYRNAGNVNVITNLGNNIVIGADNGKWAFYIETIDDGAGNLVKVERQVMYREDAGMKAALQTDQGIFYVNSQGLWNLVSIGQDNIKYSDQEVRISDILGDDYFKNANFDDADIAYDNKQGIVLVTYRENSGTNNAVLVFNTSLKAFANFTGWNLEKFLDDEGTLYGGGSNTAKIWQIFEGYSDDGNDIWTQFRQELTVGALWTRKELLGQYAQGELSQSSNIRIDFNIYDKEGKYIPDKMTLLSFQWTPSIGFVKATEYGSASWGGVWGGDVDPSGTIPSFAGYKGRIKNFQRIELEISEHSQTGHTINWVSLLTEEKQPIRIRNLTQN